MVKSYYVCWKSLACFKTFIYRWDWKFIICCKQTFSSSDQTGFHQVAVLWIKTGWALDTLALTPNSYKTLASSWLQWVNKKDAYDVSYPSIFVEFETCFKKVSSIRWYFGPSNREENNLSLDFKFMWQKGAWWQFVFQLVSYNTHLFATMTILKYCFKKLDNRHNHSSLYKMLYIQYSALDWRKVCSTYFDTCIFYRTSSAKMWLYCQLKIDIYW